MCPFTINENLQAIANLKATIKKLIDKLLIDQLTTTDLIKLKEFIENKFDTSDQLVDWVSMRVLIAQESLEQADSGRVFCCLQNIFQNANYLNN